MSSCYVFFHQDQVPVVLGPLKTGLHAEAFGEHEKAFAGKDTGLFVDTVLP